MSASNYLDYTALYRKRGTRGFPVADPDNTHRSDPEWPSPNSPYRGRSSTRGRFSNSTRRGGSSRGGSRGGAFKTGTKDTSEKGRFDNGIWMCDCNPRLPAEHFQVKKESANKGRWFYTCQRQSRGNRNKNEHLHIPVPEGEASCGFFLWEEDAKMRMEAAVLGGTRSEPRVLMSQEERRSIQENTLGAGVVVNGRAGPQTPLKRKRDGNDVGGAATPPRSPVSSFKDALADTMKLPPKRKLPWLKDDSQATTISMASDAPFASSRSSFTSAPHAAASDSEEEFFDWPLSGAEASELNRVAEEVEMNTPRKARKNDVLDTPHAARIDNGLTTPGTTPAKPAAQELAALLNNDVTPTPARFRDALAPDTPASPAGGSLTASFQNVLRCHKVSIPQAALMELNTLMKRHEAQMIGAVKGRDIARQAVKSREETIVKLTKRIEGLEGEVGGLKALVGALGKGKR